MKYQPKQTIEYYIDILKKARDQLNGKFTIKYMNDFWHVRLIANKKVFCGSRNTDLKQALYKCCVNYIEKQF